MQVGPFKSNDIVDEGVTTVVLYRLTYVAQAVTMLESTVCQLLLTKRALSGIHIYAYFTGIHALYLIVPLNHILYTVIDLCSYRYIMSCFTVLVQGLTTIQDNVYVYMYRWCGYVHKSIVAQTG